MGYKESTGLGRKATGIKEPIQASQQKGRRGLGYNISTIDLDNAAEQWDSSKEIIEIVEKIEWLVNDDPDDSLLELSFEQLEACTGRGPKSLTIDNETHFCDPMILRKILDSKTVFDRLSNDDMRRAVMRSNPFETIKSNVFLNRAAVKMANMDSMFDFMFTKPVDEFNRSMINDDLLYFADVCAGPGGFSEYILYRKKWEAKGIGFTLKGDNDFKVHDFFAGPPETFTPYYGINDDGNVYDPDNIHSLEELVMNETEVGCHFMMADGGFSVEGQENIQEILSKQIYLCQCLVALSIVRTNGHFVVKLFDLFTPFSASLIYLMYKSFKQISICKPNTSRPANSERYLVCKWKKPYTDNIKKYLFDINVELFRRKDKDADVKELISIDDLKNDRKFFDYIYESNCSIGERQIVGLLKIAAFCQDTTLTEPRQHDIKSKCLKVWGLPEENRKKHVPIGNDTYLIQLLGDKWYKEKKFMSAPEKNLQNLASCIKEFHSVLDWFFVGIDDISSSGGHRTFFMSKGRYEVFSFNMITCSWESLKDKCLIELSPNTLIYGEIVKELNGEHRGQTAQQALHIIDGVILGGKDIRHLPLTERNKMCEKFAKSLTKPVRDNKTIPIRCKKLFKIMDVENFFDLLVPRRLKEGGEKMGYDIRQGNLNSSTPRFHIPRGLLFLDEVRSDKMRQFSNSQRRIYYFDKQTNKSEFAENLQNADMFASFKNTFTTRLVWKFEIREQICEKVADKKNDYLYREDLTQFIKKKTPAMFMH